MWTFLNFKTNLLTDKVRSTELITGTVIKFRYIPTIFLELRVNNFMQISVDIQWDHRDKALGDDPKETFTEFIIDF